MAVILLGGSEDSGGLEGRGWFASLSGQDETQGRNALQDGMYTHGLAQDWFVQAIQRQLCNSSVSITFYTGSELFTLWNFKTDLNMMVWKKILPFEPVFLSSYVKLQVCKFILS